MTRQISLAAEVSSESASTAAASSGSGWNTARWAGILLLVLAGLLYAATLDNGFQPRELEGGDLITHQYAQVQARPSNAPGYPLYTLGGWLWFHGLRHIIRWLGRPLPNPIPILSSYSTFWALLSLWLLYAIVRHLTQRRIRPAGNWPLAWLLCAFYAVTYFFWYYATTTEQYSSAIAQTLAIVYVYLLWREALPGAAQVRSVTSARPLAPAPAHPRRLLFLLAFLCGLSLAHMVTVALIVPPLVLLVLWEQPGLLRRPWTVAGTVGAAALPLLSYIYVYVRGAAHPEWWGAGDWASAQAWFWSFVRTAQGREELSWGLEPGRAFFTNIFPSLIWHELSIPLLVVGLVGIVWLGRRMAILLYTTLLFYALLCWVDRFGNWYQVILPAYPLVLLGLVPLFDWAQGWLARWRRGLTWGPLLLLGLAIGWRIDASWPAANSHNRPDDTALARPALLLDQPLPVGAGLFAEKNDALGLDYLVEIWQIRPDLVVVSSPGAAQLLAEKRLVLATWQSTPLLQSELAPRWQPFPQGVTPDWVRQVVASNRNARAAPEPDVLLGKAAGDGLVLVGYTIRPGPGGAPVVANTPPTFDVTLYWQRQSGAQPGDWSISVRPLAGSTPLTDDNGLPIQQDSPGPVHGLLTFAELPPQRPVADSYRLPSVAGMDGVLVILYRPVAGGFENLAEMVLPLPAEQRSGAD